MRNTAIAKVFSDIADLLEIRGEIPFKIRAYQRAARAIEHYPKEVEIMVNENEDLRGIPGVGEAIAKKTVELVTTGKLVYYEGLKAEFPEGIVNLLAIPGVGPKTARKLSMDLGITSVDQLEQAISDGKVAHLFRLGDRTARNISQQIQALRRKDQRIPIGEALPTVDRMLEALRAVPGVDNLCYAGSLRRFRETLGDIDLMGTADDPARVIEAFVELPEAGQVLAKGPTKASILVPGGLQFDLRMVEHDSFGSLLQYFTGSKQHNISLREKGRKKGLKLSEYGITSAATERLEKFAREEDFYDRLGLQYIPPELREAQGEVEQAERGGIPRLIEEGDIRGDLHVHSKWSDGHDSIEQIALAARERGYDYVAVTDHSSGLGISHGLDAGRLRQQMQEIEDVDRRIGGTRVLRGVEVDIRADGSLDLPRELLRELDLVIASVHSAMNQGEEKITGRLVSAIADPDVDMIGHPSCRLLGEREAIAVNWETLFEMARRHGKVLEINASPQRLDLNDVHAYRAKELGVMLAIGTDAHSVAQLDYMKFGVSVARRAWCEPSDVVNTLSLNQLLALLG